MAACARRASASSVRPVSAQVKALTQTLAAFSSAIFTTFPATTLTRETVRQERSCVDCCLPRIASLATSGLAELRLEAYHEGAFENYEMTHRVLDLGVTKKLGDHQLSGGLIPTITYDVMEAFWGKRYLVRTAPDIQGIAARDVGLKLSGPLSVAEGLSYRVMYGAKATWEADKNPFNKVMGGITWRGSTGLLIDAYIDSESRPGAYDRSTVQFLVGKKTEQYTLGLEYLNQDRGEDPDLELATLMGVKKLGGPWSVMAQLHRLFKPSVKGNDIAYIPFDPTAKATNLVAGVEYRVNPHFTVSPNIVWTHYGVNELGVKPDDDVHLRLTFYVNFE